MARQETTDTPEQLVTPRPFRIGSADDRWALGRSIYTSIAQALADRSGLDDSLDYWNDLYEQNIAQRDEPWPNAPSIFVPHTTEILDAVMSRLAAAVFVARPYVVNGKTQEAAQRQHRVERYYNALFYSKGWLQPHLDCLQLSLKDGTAYMEVTYQKKKVRKRIVVWEPQTNEDGSPVVDAKGNVVRERRYLEQEQIQRGVRLRPRELRDVVMMPAWSRNSDEAMGLATKEYLDESQLRAMIAGGTLWKEEVEAALQSVQPGADELNEDQQGTATYELGGNINVSGDGTSNPEDGDYHPRLLRGKLSVWRVLTRAYDLNNDGFGDEAVAWVHDKTQRLLGIGPNEYWGVEGAEEKRFLRSLTPIPRACRGYGFGVPERLRGIQEEANATENGRLQLMDLIISPPRYHRRNVKTDQMEAWGPDADYEVDNPDDIGLLMGGRDIPLGSIQEQANLENKGRMLMGVASPGLGTPGNARKSSRETQAWQSAQNVRVDLMAMHVRLWMREILEYAHALEVQYAGESVEVWEQQSKKVLTVPFEDLAQDYMLDVAGMQGGLDKENRRADTLTLYSLLLQNPLVQGQLTRVYPVTEMVLEEFQRPDIPQLIGTVEDAQTLQQQMAQAAKQKHDEEMALQLASHSKVASPSSNGAGPRGPSPGIAGPHGP